MLTIFFCTTHARARISQVLISFYLGVVGSIPISSLTINLEFYISFEVMSHYACRTISLTIYVSKDARAVQAAALKLLAVVTTANGCFDSLPPLAIEFLFYACNHILMTTSFPKGRV